MIILNNVSKSYHTRLGQRTVLDEINLQVEKGQRVGILGRNGAGKSTLIRMISGIEHPSNGHIDRKMSISWPLAFGGAFQTHLTGLDNLRFISRVYNVDYKRIVSFVEDFADLGIYFREPVMHYSSGMLARLGFALSMAIEFDCFLIDEIIAVGDARFHEKCNFELFEKRKDRAIVLVSHNPELIKLHCNIALVLYGGKLYSFETVDQAYEFHQAHLT